MKLKTVKCLYRTSAVFFGIFLFLFCVLIFFTVATFTVDLSSRTLPSYERVDLTEILQKPTSERTEEEWNTLSLQTGILSRRSLATMPADDVLSFQNSLFFRGEVRHAAAAFTTPHDELIDPQTKQLYVAPVVELEAGDVLVTSSCHTYGWRNGHSALVLTDRRILQSVSLGYNSTIVSAHSSSGAAWFQSAANFMVLRLKDADEETRRQIADEAEKTLDDIPYDLLVGIFKPKDQGTTPSGTHCSHLVWQAYKNAGYDIDSDGGPVCTTRDIANSPLFEVVQVYGFDPVKLW